MFNILALWRGTGWNGIISERMIRVGGMNDE
jgi:hypothetical protein